MSSKAETPEFEKSIYNPSGMYGMKVGGESSNKFKNIQENSTYIIFCCEGAALEVLMSVCLSVCPSVCKLEFSGSLRLLKVTQGYLRVT